MKRLFKNKVFSVGLAIFSMFFGAGDLIFAVSVGKIYQNQTPIALTGFLITAVCLPVLGVVSILAYGGDYRQFFGRLGRVPGNLLALASLIVIAPLIAMPRIVSLSHTVVQPLIPSLSLPVFAVIFLSLTFLLAMTESRIIDILGYVISPLLVISLLIIFGAAIVIPGSTGESNLAVSELFVENVKYGYNTLNFLTSVFFGAVVIHILKKASEAHHEEASEKQIVNLGLKASFLGVAFLGLIYIGLALTGAAHSEGMQRLNEGEVFSQLMFKMLGDHGGIVLAIAVTLACLSTIIALSAVAAEFFEENVFQNKVGYTPIVMMVLGVAGMISVLGLTAIIDFSRPIISILHPGVIVLAICNLLYKWFKFPFVKAPVAIALVGSLWLHRIDLGQMLGLVS